MQKPLINAQKANGDRPSNRRTDQPTEGQSCVHATKNLGAALLKIKVSHRSQLGRFLKSSNSSLDETDLVFIALIV